MRRKIQKFRTDKFGSEIIYGSLDSCNHVNGWKPAVYMSYISQNFLLFDVSNLSALNFLFFLLMYLGSVSSVTSSPKTTAARRVGFPLMAVPTRSRCVPGSASDARKTCPDHSPDVLRKHITGSGRPSNASGAHFLPAQTDRKWKPSHPAPLKRHISYFRSTPHVAARKQQYRCSTARRSTLGASNYVFTTELFQYSSLRLSCRADVACPGFVFEDLGDADLRARSAPGPLPPRFPMSPAPPYRIAFLSPPPSLSGALIKSSSCRLSHVRPRSGRVRAGGADGGDGPSTRVAGPLQRVVARRPGKQLLFVSARAAAPVYRRRHLHTARESERPRDGHLT